MIKLSEHISNLAIIYGDEIRKWFSMNDFSKEIIMKNDRGVVHVARLLLTHDVPVFVSLIDPLMKIETMRVGL